MCWRCYQGGKAWGRNLTLQLASWQCQEIIPVNLGATLSHRAGRKVCSIPCTEHPLPKQWGVQGGVWPSMALDCSPQESPHPAARQSFDLNHKGCCFHKTCWQNRGDRRGSEKGKKKGNLKLQRPQRCALSCFSREQYCWNSGGFKDGWPLLRINTKLKYSTFMWSL